MVRSTLSRALVVLLTLTLLSSPVFAARSTLQDAGEGPSLLSALWTAFLELLPSLEKGGGGMDPWGVPSSGGTTNGGAGMDPWGTPGDPPADPKRGGALDPIG